MDPFPFRSLKLYLVRQDFTSTRSNDLFVKGQQLTYLESDRNHYEGVELCKFKELSTGKPLTWHADDHEITKWATFFEEIPYPA